MINEHNINLITDSLGKGIDPWIKNLVILFNYHGVITKASCEGHSNYGCSYPWIDFEYNSLNILLELMEEFKFHGFIHIIFLKNPKTKKFSSVRIVPEKKNITEGREQFKLFEDFLRKKSIIS